MSKPQEGVYIARATSTPVQNGPAVQKHDDARLDRRRSVVRQHDCRDDHVAAIVEDDRYRGLTLPIASVSV